MDKPALLTSYINPLFVQTYERYLPTAFDESPTLLEKVNKIIVTLNQIGELSNNVLDQWNQVMDWVMSDGLDASVDAKLNAMISDGTLSDLINQDILGNIQGRMDTAESNIVTLQTDSSSYGTSITSINTSIDDLNRLNIKEIKKDITSVGSPSNLSFSTIKNERMFSLLDEKYVEIHDDFLVDTQSNYTILNETGNGLIAVGDSVFNIVDTVNPFFTLAESNLHLKVPFATSMLKVEKTPQYATVGWTNTNSNWLVASFDKTANQVTLECRVSGVHHILSTISSVNFVEPFTLACVMNHNTLSAFVDFGKGFLHLGSSAFDSYIDMTITSNLSNWKYAFGGGASSPLGDTLNISDFKGGIYGRVGFRDPNLVRYLDGTPYILENKVYFTGTEAGIGLTSESANASHFGVFRMDLGTHTIENVGKIFNERAGKRVGDHAGNIVYNPDTGQFIIAVSTWGDATGSSGTSIMYTLTDDDILHGFHIITGMTTLNIPTTTSVYDPDIVLIDNTYYVGYTETSSKGQPWTFYPALAKGSDLNSLVVVSKDQTVGSMEGTKLQKVGGQWYLFAGGDNTYKIYDLQMNVIGYLNAPCPSNIGLVYPHPLVIPYNKNGKTYFLMITFNGRNLKTIANTRGDIYVMEASQSQNGYEFPVYIDRHRE